MKMCKGVFHVWCQIRGGGRLAPSPWTDRQPIPKDLKALNCATRLPNARSVDLTSEHVPFESNYVKLDLNLE